MLGLIFKIKIKEYEETIEVSAFSEAMVSFEVELYKRGLLKTNCSVCDMIPQAMTKFKRDGFLSLKENVFIRLENATILPTM